MSFPATAIIEVRTTGSDLNGGGFNSARGGTDYSQQNSAQATGTVTSSSTTVTATTSIFTSIMVGNYITDGTTWKEITAYTSATVVTVDSAPSWTAATIKVGGALASIGAGTALQIDGNIVYVKATGTYSISSTITTYSSPPSDSVNRIIGYTSTRGDGGRPTIQATGGSFTMVTLNAGISFEGFIVDGNSQSSVVGISLAQNYCQVYNCYAKNCPSGEGIVAGSGTAQTITFCEVSGCGNGAIGSLRLNGIGGLAVGCYVHDNYYGITAASGGGMRARFCICSNNTSDGFLAGYNVDIQNCVSYGNGGRGIGLDIYIPANCLIQNNILINNASYGLSIPGGPGTVSPAISYNAFYNNTSGPRQGITAGTGDVTLTGDPFTNAAAGDFSLNNTAGAGAACRGAGFPGLIAGGLTTGHIDIGAAQHQDSGGGTATFSMVL